MNSRLILSHCVMALSLWTSGALHAQGIDYDPMRSQELKPCDDHRYHGRNEAAQECYSQVFSDTNNMVVRAQASWATDDVQTANVLFRAASQNNPRSYAARNSWGRLFLATHQHDEALKLFREALNVDPNNVQAKLGMAQTFAQRFDGTARTLVNEVLQQHDDAIEAHLLRAQMDLEEGDLDQVEKSLDRAMALIERAQLPPLEVYSLRAALDLMRGGDGAKWANLALKYNPHYGSVFATLAHFEVMRRRYQESTAFLKRAVEVEPKLASAHAELGENLLRLGNIDAGQQELKTAYENDPYSVTTVNMLRLLDRFGEFEQIDVKNDAHPLRLKLHRTEAAVLHPYVEELAQKAVDTFSKRYRFEPKQVITIEIYPNHDDFAVRVGGLPGIGLLGVTFGYLLAMDSPSGRATGDFHWGSTLWHEMAHVFTLEATEHRVPRWLSEGISVFEEWRTGPTPGVVLSMDTLAAFHDGKFLKIEDLDQGFIRPRYQNQVQVSYMQAGLVCLFIEQQFGFDKLVALLNQFKRDVTVASAVKGGLGVNADEFDRRFKEFMQQRYAKILPKLDDWKRLYTVATQAAEKEDWPVVVEATKSLVELYPEDASPNSPYVLLAKAYLKTEQPDRAMETLRTYRRVGGWDPEALQELANQLLKHDQRAEAIEVLNALNYSDPLHVESHLQLADALLTAAQPQQAAREYNALLALNTRDKATAYFGIARAQRMTGNRAASRRHLLQALEAAPNFKPAQQLLLEMTDERE